MLGYENKLCSFYFVCYASSFTPILWYENKLCSFYFVCYASSFTPILGYENKLCSFYFVCYASSFQGRIQDFKLGGSHLKKLRRAEGGAKLLGYFV